MSKESVGLSLNFRLHFLDRCLASRSNKERIVFNIYGYYISPKKIGKRPGSAGFSASKLLYLLDF